MLGALTADVGDSGVSLLKGMVLSRMSRRLSAVVEEGLGLLLTGETTLSRTQALSASLLMRTPSLILPSSPAPFSSPAFLKATFQISPIPCPWVWGEGAETEVKAKLSVGGAERPQKHTGRVGRGPEGRRGARGFLK